MGSTASSGTGPTFDHSGNGKQREYADFLTKEVIRTLKLTLKLQKVAFTFRGFFIHSFSFRLILSYFFSVYP